ncbi:MAG: spore maturation protein [Bacilli bacterium]|nr:spore maturation protein [Bacilli bacterium]
MITYISSLMLPCLVLFIVAYGLYKKVDIYNVFVDGAKEAFDMLPTLFTCILGMILGINLFLESNILGYFLDAINPVLKSFQIPAEIIPMAIMRPISGGSTLALLNNLFETYGPDSYIGRIGSVIQGSTETTFYVLTLYFGSVGIKKIRHALWVGLLVDLIGIISGIVIVGLFFN